MKLAFGVEDYQIAGAPSWVRATRYDIAAKIDEANIQTLSKTTLHERRAAYRLMLRSLISERCGLKFHSETKTLPVYLLMVAKHGPKLPSTDALKDGESGMYRITAVGMPALVTSLEQRLRRPIIDRTGLSGDLHFRLAWTSDMQSSDLAAPVLSGSASNGPSLFTALRDQLGLRLKSAKAPVPIIVIDEIQPPTPN